MRACEGEATMADSWEDEEFDAPALPPTSAPVSWEDEVRKASSEIFVCTREVWRSMTEGLVFIFPPCCTPF